MPSTTRARLGRAQIAAMHLVHRLERLEPRRLLSAGAPDPSFGGDGTVTTDLVGRTDALAAAVTLATPAGKLLVAGQTRHAGGYDFALARYTADGRLDRTFGDGGRVVTDVNNGSFDEIVDVVVLPSGKIVAAGNTAHTPYQGYGDGADFAVARYNRDGSLDRTFGNGGIVITNLGRAISDGDGNPDTADVAAAMAIAPGGKLVVVGSTGYVGGGDVAVVRYSADGSLDQGFGGGDGVVTTNVYPPSEDGEISASDDAAGAVYIHPDGRILVGGRAGSEFLLVRYLPDGTLDTSFGRGHGPDSRPTPGLDDSGGDPGDPGDGFVTTRFAGGASGIADLAVSLGRVVAVGAAASGFDGSSGDFGIARYDLRTGALDRMFSGDGKLTVDFAGGRDEAAAVLARRDGSVFVAGYATTPGTLEDFALARIDVRGRPVASFGTRGKVTTDFATAGGPTYDRATAATFTPDGRIVLGGSAGALPGGDLGTSGPNFGLARYFPSGALDRSFGPGARGTVATAFRGSLANYGGDAVVQRDGKVVVAGNVNLNAGLWDILLVRYNRDGSLDRTFGVGGIVTTDLSAAGDGRSSDGVSKVALDRFGRILVVGATDRRLPGAVDGLGTRRWDVFVARYSPNGTLDRTFGDGAGFVVTDLGNDYEYPTDLAVAPDGKVVAVAETRATGDSWNKIAVIRYLPSGALDPTFDGDGIATTDLPGPIGERSGGVAVQGDGRIVVSGVAWEENTGQNFAVLRYTVDGSLDASFGGGDGWLTTDFGGSDAARAVTLMADGRIVVAGEGQAAHARRYSDFAVARYLADGTFDPSFGQGGSGRALLARDGADDTWDAANDVHVQSDGKVVLIGTSVHFPDTSPTGSGAGRGDFAAVRFRADGTADSDFGAGGLAIVGFDGFSSAGGGGIDPDGNLVLAGGVFAYDRQTRATGTDFAVARLLL